MILYFHWHYFLLNYLQWHFSSLYCYSRWLLDLLHSNTLCVDLTYNRDRDLNDFGHLFCVNQIFWYFNSYYWFNFNRDFVQVFNWLNIGVINIFFHDLFHYFFYLNDFLYYPGNKHYFLHNLLYLHNSWYFDKLFYYFFYNEWGWNKLIPIMLDWY